MAVTEIQEATDRTSKSADGGAHPSGDNRFKILEATMKKTQYKADALIEVLHTAQQLFGYLEEDVLMHVARKLKLPPSRVFGVATFYHLFTLKPGGRHTCVVCLGTACYVKGAANIIKSVEELADFKVGETTEDGELSLMTARCIGACGIAPAVVFDGQVSGTQTPASVLAHVKGWLTDGSK
jgi:bidirectional [NiFe] hydrogenase diaphorase subunit